MKESWRGRKELDYVDLPSEFKSSLFLFPDGRNRIRAAEIVLEEMVANVKGDDDESTKEERKEKRKRIRGSFIISIAIYGPGNFNISFLLSFLNTDVCLDIKVVSWIQMLTHVSVHPIFRMLMYQIQDFHLVIEIIKRF